MPSLNGLVVCSTGLGSGADWLKGMHFLPLLCLRNRCYAFTFACLSIFASEQYPNILCFDCSWERASTKRGCWKFLRSSLASNGHGFRGEGCGLSMAIEGFPMIGRRSIVPTRICNGGNICFYSSIQSNLLYN